MDTEAGGHLAISPKRQILSATAYKWDGIFTAPDL